MFGGSSEGQNKPREAWGSRLGMELKRKRDRGIKRFGFKKKTEELGDGEGRR